ncbi:MAG: BamA/TamA family outer membrane protein [Bacteroidales bacterium]|nr:BamA/TamA family outer membrane protein [Bacteroidales bacterium]
MFLLFIVKYPIFSQKKYEYYLFPILTYDADVKLRTGVMQYYYRKNIMDSSLSWYATLETSITSTKTHVFQLLYDTYKAFSKIRLMGEVSSMHELMSDFYGFNGSQTQYHEGYELSSSAQYISFAFYKMERTTYRITTDVFKPAFFPHLTFFSGFHMYSYIIRSLKNQKFLNGKILVPDTLTLYDYYVSTGNISDTDKKGGNIYLLRGGITFDTRNSLFYPTKGMYVESFFSGGLPYRSNVFLRYNMLVKGFVPFFKEKLVFAIRMAYQDHYLHMPPFYFLSYLSTTQVTCPFHEGLGGFRSIRGIIKNRIIAPGIVYGNVESRLNTFNFRIKKLALTMVGKTFMDAGKIVRFFPLQNSPLSGFPHLINDKPDGKIAFGFGTGIYFVLNKKLILSIDYAITTQKQLGQPSWYIYSGVSF